MRLTEEQLLKKIAKLENAAGYAQLVLEEAVNAGTLMSGSLTSYEGLQDTEINDDAVTAIILLGEAIEANEVQA